MNKKKLSILIGGVVIIGAIITTIGITAHNKKIEKEKITASKEVVNEVSQDKQVENEPKETSKENDKKESEKTDNSQENNSQENDNKEEDNQKKSDEEKLNEKKQVESETSKKVSNNSTNDSSNKKPSSNQVNNIDKISKAKNVAQDYIGSKNVGVYCTDLATGKSFGINENKIYYSASTGKLPGILYTQKKLNEGAISTNTKYAYHDYVNDIPGAMIRGGTGVLQNNIHDGKEVSVGTLLKDTCSYSDNLASNMLGYYVCDKNAGAFKEYTSNIIGRHIGTFAKEFSAKETALLMKEIYNQGGQAIENLKNTSWDKVKIPKYLPVSVAHKIGINGSYNHDVAIVYGNHPYVLSIMSNGASDEFIAQLSKKIYDELN
ncbi:serine hydrolase [Clostridium perfringens]|nr:MULTISPECIES: serine hydrolase [Clostridium]ELC8368305.1 serine hydrolase [Clostridium perfringens]MDK0888281.1 serine hydrolase [Clostridium perfringens]WVM62261.1 serine hydrolase [Clostridium perfringens]